MILSMEIYQHKRCVEPFNVCIMFYQLLLVSQDLFINVKLNMFRKKINISVVIIFIWN